MNERGISEIAFEEVCTVEASQTARSLFARLVHGSSYACHMLDGLATGYLVAILESVCIREMLKQMDPATEIIVGSEVNVRHRAPVPPGQRLVLRGWTTQIGERKATFSVQAVDDLGIVCEGSLTFVATVRAVIEERLTRTSPAS